MKIANGGATATSNDTGVVMKTCSDAQSLWSGVGQAPPDPILGLVELWKKDPDPRKMNLGVGAYRTEEGKPQVLKAVREAEARLSKDVTRTKEYLPTGGDPEFCRLSRQLAFGVDCTAVKEDRIATVQCLSGTGSLRVGAEFLVKHYPVKVVLLPNPTWSIHHGIFQAAGLQMQQYRYYKPDTRGLYYEGLLEDLRAAPEGAILVLHACAHNPTGVDPNEEQWKGILEVVKEKKLFPFFDSAYQGFASGDVDQDALSIRMFTNAGLELMLAQSYAKNMGMYGERVGALSAVCCTAQVARDVETQFRSIIRPMYSSPPIHGAAVVACVLGDEELCRQWKEELSSMSTRIKSMRKKLHAALLAVGAPGDWTHILKQIGMFSYTGLTRGQCEQMTQKWHVYMTMDGRISMAGLSADRCIYLAEAINDCARTG